MKKLIYLSVVIIFSACSYEQSTLRRGYRDFARGEYHRAIFNFNCVLAENPTNVVAYFYRGFCFSDMEQDDKALADWKKCVELKPDFIEAYINIADIYRLSNQTNEAIKYLSRGIKLKPDWIALTNAYADRCYIYYNMGKYKEAEEDFKKLIELVPDNFGYINDYAYFLSVCPDGKYRNGKKALQLAKKALKIAVKYNNEDYTALVLSTLAAAYAEIGDFKQAIKYQKQSINIAKKIGKKKIVKELEKQLKLYKNNKPWREKIIIGF